MIHMQTLAQATAGRRRRDTPQFVGFITDLIVSDDDAWPRPQAYLVEQTPNWTLPTHFHTQHQFQLFVSGTGSLGKHGVRKLEVHYASPYSAYGPLQSGPDGLAYLTLRLISDTGAWYLPESRPHLPLRIKKQQLHAAPSAEAMAQPLMTLEHVVEEVLIPLTESGLAAWLIRIPPGQKAVTPACADNNGGRFYVVTEGELKIGDVSLAALGSLYSSSVKNSNQALDLQAVATGAELIVLQFPASAMVPTDTAETAM
ncbi:hypothetical protein [Glaciimonas immobilis]|uniref:Quercetin 2,3-dioxygenase C-terminal cupin domain-containing protein n=1 Tax=Glaciimonas immobilis TaxID=728004 RepID=A0A840RVL5_9BURK|nr:hypothetical protein [Glaciimonas immobilis]KAF3996503.1 hypothetical protein HAV38_17840 [Glaciimonas immobilis]MBB5201138.1 hypothetical protein [Glaciimonas immobilis]